MQKLRNIFKWSALSLALSFLIIFSARAQTASTTDPQTTCTGGGGKWCLSSGGSASGWCSYSTSPCPAYDSASCSAQSGEWCAYTAPATGGYCNSTPGTCPINDQATCTSKSRTWCAGTSGATGWCATTGATCPAYDAASCTAQSGEWCAPSYSGGTGWCATGGYSSCPINDKATCTTKGRNWCSDYSSVGGYCAAISVPCPNTATSTTYTPPPTYPSTAMSWPSTESDCTKYKGVWCKSAATYSTTYTMPGSCMMAGQTCYVSPPAGMMTCWDGSTVSNYSSCPSTPSTKTDCEAKGANWCASTAAGTTYVSTGYCMGKSSSCPKYPPAGQMSCPDNQTFATALTDCPTASSVTQPTIKTCPDGSIVAPTAVCPVTFKTCPDGSKVETTVTCPVKIDDSVSACLDKKGVWCLDKAGGNGYCAIGGKCSTTLPEDKKEPVLEKQDVLDAKQTRIVESMKKDYARNLDTLEKTFKRLGDQASLAKITALKEKLATLPSDTSAFDALENVKDDILTLREVKNDLISQKGETELSTRDVAMQVKALKQLKKNMLAFEKQLSKASTKVDRLEKQGFSLPVALKDLLAQGKELTGKIKETTNFEEARDAGEALARLSEDLNLWATNIDQLVKISSLMGYVNGQITAREAALKSVKALAARLKIDLQANLDEVGATLASVREAYGQLKTKEWGEEEPFEFVQAAIIDKLEDADNDMANIRALANLKASVNKITAQINNFNVRITRLVKQKKDVAELQGLVEQLKETHGELKVLAEEKLANLDVANVLEKLGAANALMEEIRDLLKISAPSLFEKQLKQNFKAEKIEVPEIEKQVIRAYRVATFFRRAPEQMAEYASGVKEAVNRWRNRLAIDE